ncbi:MAG: MazG nucleotide pyrophosphohydrolase domain-containing protein [Candidatus Saccharimonadales bacterium]
MSELDYLSKDASLAEIQAYVKKVLDQRGLNSHTSAERIMLLTEELGELARGVRKHTLVKTSATTSSSNVAEEAADVLILLLDLCNHLEVNLYEAFIHKEKINQTRTWS